MALLMDFNSSSNGGRAVFSIKPDQRHYNGLGIAHGGGGHATRFGEGSPSIHVPAGKIFTRGNEDQLHTTDEAQNSEVLCEASVIHVGGRTAPPKPDR